MCEITIKSIEESISEYYELEGGFSLEELLEYEGGEEYEYEELA